ncbi:MAG: gfo/Idh/MocA family oxidoreductase, partial [Clostridia bacterium]|nr:gfo/Idh/MocA family oxidoreductase [Clostridia bacterium]
TNRFEVQMDRAKLVADETGLHVWEFEMSEPEFSRTNTVPFGAPKVTELNVELDGENPQHVGVLNAWAGAILRGTPLVADGSEGIKGVTISNAMHLSAFLGKPVTLPVDEDLYYEELQKRVATSHAKTGEQVFSDTSNTYGGMK